MKTARRKQCGRLKCVTPASKAQLEPHRSCKAFPDTPLYAALGVDCGRDLTPVFATKRVGAKGHPKEGWDQN